MEKNIELFLAVMQEQRSKSRMHVHAFVVMPNHVHLLLTPAPDVSLEKAVQYLKGGFSFQFKSVLPVWERSFNEERVRDAEAFSRMKTYIENNPLRAGMVNVPQDFRWSSAARSAFLDATPTWFNQG